MFGWLKKKERKEHLKLVQQNGEAAKLLSVVQSVALETGAGGDQELLIILQRAVFDKSELLSFLAINQMLPVDVFQSQIQLNRNLRALYDGLISGKTAFAEEFKKGQQKFQKFDRRFTPPEGWDAFFANNPLLTD